MVTHEDFVYCKFAQNSPTSRAEIGPFFSINDSCKIRLITAKRSSDVQDLIIKTTYDRSNLRVLLNDTNFYTLNVHVEIQSDC